MDVGGRAKNVKFEKLRNDMVDVNFAAFATYFDDLPTADAKATERSIGMQSFCLDAFSSRRNNKKYRTGEG